MRCFHTAPSCYLTMNLAILGKTKPQLLESRDCFYRLRNRRDRKVASLWAKCKAWGEKLGQTLLSPGPLGKRKQVGERYNMEAARPLEFSQPRHKPSLDASLR